MLALELVQEMVGALGDLAGDGQLRPRRAATAGGLSVEGTVGTVLASGVLGCLHERPAQRRRAGLGQPAATAAVCRLLDEGVEVYAYFRHEDEPSAPQYAERLLARLN